jgi:hypothetical protein
MSAKYQEVKTGCAPLAEGGHNTGGNVDKGDDLPEAARKRGDECKLCGVLGKVGGDVDAAGRCCIECNSNPMETTQPRGDEPSLGTWPSRDGVLSEVAKELSCGCDGREHVVGGLSSRKKR